jgi:hypothetical protein
MTITIDVQPELGIYKILKHLKYKPWYAIGEFVDNSIQSFISKNGKHEYRDKCRVEIEYNPNTDFLEIRDNSYGISEIDFTRAFKAGLPPSDSSGLSEFGIGMKSAGMWFSPHWEVETSPIESENRYKIIFNVEDILANRGLINAVQLKSTVVKGYTTLRLHNCHQRLVGRTLGKVKAHLASIYREFIKCGQLCLIVNGEELEYNQPKILFAPYIDEPHSNSVLWKREISIQLSPGKLIHGFYALLAVGSRSDAGFALFRRKRLILGSFDDTYRPPEIFGDSGSFVYQRLFGEIHLDGFEVSHTKDDFIWGDEEITLIDLLLQDLKASQYLRQATSSYRRLSEDKTYTAEMSKSISKVAQALDSLSESKVSELLEESQSSTSNIEQNIYQSRTGAYFGDIIFGGDTESLINSYQSECHQKKTLYNQTITFKQANELWNIHIRLDDTPSKALYTLTADDTDSLKNIAPIRNITGKIFTNHGLITNLCGNNEEAHRVLVVVIASLICTEVQIRMQYPFSSALRHVFNELLQVIAADEWTS